MFILVFIPDIIVQKYNPSYVLPCPHLYISDQKSDVTWFINKGGVKMYTPVTATYFPNVFAAIFVYVMLI
jgi:hypothetical protein